ncbi:CpsD/CapB family tyrosine-protein kinase [Amphibacillus sediminis]|uniref:CpsD/CapB family tyrosine-protein kinase n=1 Tax=Amphibacillus sediminis TaxID=360185 RepID=UPI00082EDAF0|nr:CpsD/CapB family tyrosine-protein kinase [Amphibacillus sediminis]
MAKRKKPASNSIRHLITKLNPRSPISEQYRTIRTNLQFSAVDNDLETIMITSAGPAEGKSSTAANLAIVFAQQEKRVLLVDADMRKPTVHYTFRTDNRRGLSSVLIGELSLSEATAKSEVGNLDILSAGPIPPNPSELLSSKAMSQLIKEAKNYYDIIVFDTPPVLAVTDAQLLANEVDGTLLVVRSKKTDQEAAVKAKELLLPAKSKLLGVVLNDRELTKNQYYYYGD